jgi:NDP-sugar pyrophosphorylase family protein
MNSDELTNMDLSKMIDRHKKSKPLVTMALAPLHCRLSVVKVEDDSRITGFEYGKRLWSVPVSIGIYIFNKKILDCISGSGSLEETVFRRLASEGGIVGYMLSEHEEWSTINTVKDVEEAEASLRKWYNIG